MITAGAASPAGAADAAPPGRSRPSRACGVEQHQRGTAAAGRSPLAAGSARAAPLSAAAGFMPQLRSISSRMRRLVALSSTTSTGRPCRHRRRRRPARWLGASASPKPCGEVERAALARLALDPDAPAHQLDELRRDGQAQPGAAVLARRRGAIGLAEGLEDRLLLVRRNADAGVADAEMQSHRLRPSAYRVSRRTTTSPALGELDGVADQVDDDLPQPARVADQRVGHVRRDVTGQLQPLGGRAGPASACSVSPRRVAQAELDRTPARACPPRSWRSRGCR